MTLKIYHNPRCQKSRNGLAYLTSKGIEVVVRDYLKEPLTRKELDTLLLKLHISPDQLVRTQEDYFKKELKGRNFNSEEWITILLENPKLIQRPIVEGKYKAVIANPPEEMERLQELKNI
ncbi:arsenate reductase family protein [Williamwhitmania taraxaci]|uniref:Arsenate reductase n=1 Tax=Williamwhitmania taraxaci TaxID=1640674 RepID=A0A1G6KNV5_9BACT|nr:arsenate reductase family protein [Williamwhitmania taraxaci]SDC32643.1 arsenate reductase [Williamwhitmania taraxaci]